MFYMCDFYGCCKIYEVYLILQMSEEDTFKSLCYMMFDLNIRIQYKPDMNAVQV